VTVKLTRNVHATITVNVEPLGGVAVVAEADESDSVAAEEGELEAIVALSEEPAEGETAGEFAIEQAEEATEEPDEATEEPDVEEEPPAEPAAEDESEDSGKEESESDSEKS
jgi:outer membrane biosynthesis protein TonB